MIGSSFGGFGGTGGSGTRTLLVSERRQRSKKRGGTHRAPEIIGIVSPATLGANTVLRDDAGQTLNHGVTHTYLMVKTRRSRILTGSEIIRTRNVYMVISCTRLMRSYILRLNSVDMQIL